MPEQVTDLWAQLAGVVNEPSARARMDHLLFELGGPDRCQHATTPADAYVAAAAYRERDLDAVRDLAVAIRLTWVMHDDGRVDVALESPLDLALRHLDAEQKLVGVILRDPDASEGSSRHRTGGSTSPYDSTVPRAFSLCVVASLTQCLGTRHSLGT